MFSSLIIFKDLLKKLPYEEQVILLNFLSDKTKQDVEIAPSIFVPLDFDKFVLNDLFQEIHYSWLIPFLETFDDDKALFLSSLQEPLISKIKNYFNIESQTVSNLSLPYFKNLLTDYLLQDKKDLLPKDYLPDSELNLLLDLSKNELIFLMDYLALFDLAIQMHKIVDPKILKKINLFLDDSKKQFLKSKSNYKESFSFPPLNLDKDEEDFLFALHRRGLNRFAKALSNQDNNLIWYLAHTLDIGRGKTLIKFTKEKTSKEIISSITSNIIELLPIIKTKAKRNLA